VDADPVHLVPPTINWKELRRQQRRMDRGMSEAEAVLHAADKHSFDSGMQGSYTNPHGQYVEPPPVRMRPPSGGQGDAELRGVKALTKDEDGLEEPEDDHDIDSIMGWTKEDADALPQPRTVQQLIDENKEAERKQRGQEKYTRGRA
jgi:hypothetical protein